MTTNSYGSALPAFDFQPSITQITKSGARRVPRSAKLVPLVAAAGLAYYVGSQISAQRNAALDGDDATARFKAVQDAYGDRSSLQNLEAAARLYASSAVNKGP